jgi:predicted DNA-binding transcriptional regulator AlpA
MPQLIRRDITTINTRRLARLTGASERLIYRQLHADPERLPIQPIRLGARLRWPVAAVVRLTGLPVEAILDPRLDSDDDDQVAAVLSEWLGGDRCADHLDALAAAAVSPALDDGETPDAA